ncbi:MAG: PKD domain-containing protein [Bacteroidia bacterium]|nr:PKD domain-containing protein [Bacteroidia bacterium]
MRIVIGMLLLVLSFPSTVLSQITITAQDMPTAGDAIRVSRGNTNLTTYANYSSGPNQTWDFTNVPINRQEVIEYKSSLQTPYFFFFFTSIGNKIADTLSLLPSNIQLPIQLPIPLTLTNVYNFYQSTTFGSTSFKVTGIGATVSGIPVPAFYEDPDELYLFPLKHQDRDTTTFRFKINVPNTFIYSTTGTRINIVEGWGVVKTPIGDFDCLKVRSIISARDTITLQQPIQFSFPFPNNRVEIKYIAKNRDIPVVQINGVTFGNQTVWNEIILQDINRAPEANFTTSATVGCRPFTVTFTSNSERADDLTWNFGDGSTGTGSPITHTYWNRGTYLVTLTASNTYGVDTIRKQITVAGTTVAFSAIQDTVYTPPGYVEFINQSEIGNVGNYQYLWNFGDGYLNTNFQPGHRYRTPGTYTVSLIVTSPEGCKDSLVKPNAVVILAITEIDESVEMPAYRIYPNPCSGKFNLEHPEIRKLETVKIIDLYGKMICELVPTKNEHAWELQLPETMSNGLYIVQMNGDGKLSFGKLFVKRE